jgi:hypothetical protein
MNILLPSGILTISSSPEQGKVKATQVKVIFSFIIF